MPVARSPAGTAVAQEDGVERDADGHGWGRCVLMAAPTATRSAREVHTVERMRSWCRGRAEGGRVKVHAQVVFQLSRGRRGIVEGAPHSSICTHAIEALHAGDR